MCNINYENINPCLVLSLKGKVFNISSLGMILVINFGGRYPLSDRGSSLLFLICFDRRTYAKLQNYGRVLAFENNICNDKA